jgi:hypothetical protein
MTPSAPLTIASLDVPVPTLAARLRAGRRAEQRHLLHDPDPDSTVPALAVSLTKTVVVTR